MLAYRGSDVKFSWDNHENMKLGYKPCAFVKEGLGSILSWLVKSSHLTSSIKYYGTFV